MAYVRMLVAMTTCGMMDMQFWLSHMYTVLKVATLDDKEGGLTEETRGYLAVLYDDCRRQAWADQRQQGPHTRDMRVEAGLICEHTMVQARVKLADVMQAMRVQKLAEMEHMDIVPVYTQQWDAQASWCQLPQLLQQKQQTKIPKSKAKAQKFFQKCKEWKQEKQKEARQQEQQWAWSSQLNHKGGMLD